MSFGDVVTTQGVFLEEVCLEHKQTQNLCPWPAPYALHSRLMNDETNGAWLASLKLKYPQKRVYVFYFNFID